MIIRKFLEMIFLLITLLIYDSAFAQEKDFCQEPETPSQRRILEIIDECTSRSPECDPLTDCLSESLVNISEETAKNCGKSDSQTDSSSSNGFRSCSVAATAYVILEQIRRLLIEETVYKDCREVKYLLRTVLRQCGEKDEFSTISNEARLDLNDLRIQEILAKFLIGIGKRMQKYEVVRRDIEGLERTKHMKALGAMIVSFALPGLFGLCEAAHFRTGIVLQTLALFIIGIYQFSRYGGYWAFVGVGSCLLVMIVELAILVLIKRKFYTDSGQEKKTE